MYDEQFEASGDECYKIFRTYRIINWCEYDGISDPLVISRVFSVTENKLLYGQKPFQEKIGSF